jgi:hypothetical protein
VSEEQGAYQSHDAERDDLDGVQRIGELIRQILEERDWPIPHDRPDANGDHRPGSSRRRRES